MADYSAKIQLIVDGLQSLDKVEQKVKEIHRLTAGGWRVDLQNSQSFKKLNNDLDALANKGRAAAKSLQDSFKNVGTLAKGAGIAGAAVAINQFGAALEAASTKAGLFSPAIQTVGSALKTALPGVDALVNAFTALPPALQATAPAIAAVTAGLVAFNQPIRTAIADTQLLGKTLNPIKEAIKNAFGTTLLMAFSDSLDMSLNAVKNYRTALLSLTDTVADLNRRKAALQTVLNSTNSSTDTAVKIAGKLVDVTVRLNAEQQAQNDLLREAAGLRSTSVEKRATNTYNVTQRRKAFELKQTEDQIALEEALLRLEQKSAVAANAELQARGELARLTAQGINAAKFKVAQPSAPLMLPAFQERGLQLLDNSIKLNESQLRIEQALNGERARGVRFLEKQSQEEARQVQLGILGQKTNRLPGATAVSGGPFPTEGPIPLSAYGQRNTAVRGGIGQAVRGRASGAIGNALIGGAFPLLFGQGPGAAAGGAIGGLVGGAFGGVGGFAGSLIGTLLGDIASRGQAVKQLAEDIGFSAQQTQQLSKAFKVANTDVEKFTAVIQNIRGVGLEIEDQAKAIQLVTRLTELYGGSFEKTGNAITAALESGKVSQATLNQLTSQGINVQQALADKYKVSRSAILEMAKDGDISVQTLIDTLVALGNDSEKVAVTQQNVFQNAYDQIAQAAVQAAQTASGSFTSTGNALQEIAGRIQKAFAIMFNELIKGTTEFILGLGEIARIAGTTLDSVLAKFVGIQYGIIEAAKSLPVLDSGIIEFAKNALAVLNPVGTLIDKIRGAGRSIPQQYGPPVPERLKRTPLEGFNALSQLQGTGATKAKGPKPPEDRTPQLKEDLKAMQLMSVTQDGIRDALFEGDRALAIRLEYDQKVYDINRDTAKAILNANNESEKAVFRAQEIVRLKDAQLERLDKERDLQSEIDDAYQETFRFLQEGIDWEKGLLKSDEIGEFIQSAVQELQNLQSVAINVSQGIGDAVGSALTNGITGLITGANTAKQVFADLMQSVGQILADQGAKMIATYVAIGIAKLFAGLGGGSIFGGKMGVDTFGTMNMPGLEGAGALGNGLGLGAGVGVPMPGGIPAFRASGGPVSNNQPYVVGERGPELFMPGTGGTVVNNRDLRDAMGTAPGSRNGPMLNMTFQTTNIGGVEYVSREQLESAMMATRKAAADDGAKRGTAATLSRLQNSPSTRAKLGLR